MYGYNNFLDMLYPHRNAYRYNNVACVERYR